MYIHTYYIHLICNIYVYVIITAMAAEKTILAQSMPMQSLAVINRNAN